MKIKVPHKTEVNIEINTYSSEVKIKSLYKDQSIIQLTNIE